VDLSGGGPDFTELSNRTAFPSGRQRGPDAPVATVVIRFASPPAASIT
jgi:hypothetical protein